MPVRWIFDVTDGVNPQQMETSLNGTELSFSIPASASLREFVVVKTFTDKSSRDGRRGGESESACFATARYDHYCPA